MSRMPMQMDLFGGPEIPFDVLEPAPPPPPEPKPEPVILPLEGQYDLLAARSVRLNAIVLQLLDGRFQEALARARGLIGEQVLASALDALEASVSAAPDAEALATLDLAPHVARLGELGNDALAAAVSTGRDVAVARWLESEGPASRAQGRLAGHWWANARRTAEATRSFERAVAAEPLSGEALVGLANARFAHGDVAGARELYRRALRIAPGEVALDEVADPEVTALQDDARELGLSPAAEWMPLVGLLRGVFGPSPETFEGVPTPADRFAAALVRSRVASSRGTADVASRREMKQLAPALFAELLEEGLL